MWYIWIIQKVYYPPKWFKKLFEGINPIRHVLTTQDG